MSAVARRTLFYIRTIAARTSPRLRHARCASPSSCTREFPVERAGDVSPQACGVLTSPAVEGYSMPWYKQLVAHEYRHAVQYNNLIRGVIRALSYVLGQQGSTIGLLCMPIWAMEGDAVDVRSFDDVVVRTGIAALVLDGLPRDGQRRPRPAQHRPLVLRLLPRLHFRPLRTGIPDMFLCLGALRRERLGQGRVVRFAQPLRAGHHARRSGQVL